MNDFYINFTSGGDALVGQIPAPKLGRRNDQLPLRVGTIF
jgi:hypothetical protein